MVGAMRYLNVSLSSEQPRKRNRLAEQFKQGDLLNYCPFDAKMMRMDMQG